MASLDPTIPVTTETLALRIRHLQARPRFNAVLLTMFAGMGLLLAALGTYAVLAFLVAQRSREIAVRIALGAQRRDVLKLAIGEGMRWAIGGLAAGLSVAVAFTRWMSGLLFGIRATDPVIYMAVGLVLILVALGACYIPARHALRVDPMDTLRSQ